MSKNYYKRNTALIKKDGLEKILKETRQSDLEYKTTKNIKVENSKNKNQLVNRNNENSNKLSRQLTKQEGKITIKLKELKENNNDNPPNNENIDENNIIEQIQKENESYKEKIKELEEKIEKMTSEYSNNIQKHRIELEQNEKQMKKLISTNKNLKNSLEVLTQRLDKVIINSNTKKVKIQNKASEYQELQHQLEVKERELKNQQQLINILTKDNKNIRNILNNLNNFGINENNINLTEKIQQQYQEIQNLQKNLKELKLKLEQKQNSTHSNIDSKDINFNTDEDNSIQKKSNFFLNSNKKIKLNSFSRAGSSFNIHKINKFTNISQSLDKTKDKKKMVYRGLNSSNSVTSNVEAIFTNEEINTIKNSFYDEKKYESFINKINILEKATKSKEKEMNMKIKLIENKLKDKEKELIELKKQAKEKESKILTLNIQNKELKKNKEDLLNKINFLAQTLNQLDIKNQMILKKNEQIKNSIFNIDGIIEGKLKEGKTIPLLMEVKSNDINIEKNNNKNGNYSINQSSREEKNSYKYTNSDEIGEDN